MSDNSSVRARSRKGTTKAVLDKPPKPYDDFPLCPANCGAWQKKIRGKVHYFGPWGRVRNGKLERLPDNGWQAALELYNRQKDFLFAGLTPRDPADERPTLALLCNRFLTAKKRKLEAREISGRMFDEYKATTDRLISRFGKERLAEDFVPSDFEGLRADLAKAFGPVRLGNEIQKVKTVFTYGFEANLIDKQLRFGPEFKKPSAAVMRRHRAKNGKRMLEAAELRKLLEAADQQLRAMILLGVNCGLGNHDCALLPLEKEKNVLDLKRGWLDYPRRKTGIERRCPLWPETVDALQKALAGRPEPKLEDAKDLVFVTVRGRPWTSRDIANPISVATRDLMKKVGVHRKGIGFYTLRHIFETIGGGSRDQVAVNCIMGHADSSMAATYRESIEDSRLQAVVDHVRTWLWPAHAGEVHKPKNEANNR